MARLRSEQDPEERPGFEDTATRYRTPANIYEVNCWVCGDTYYVDEETFGRLNTSIEAGLDNPFACADCEEAGEDDLAYGR